MPQNNTQFQKGMSLDEFIEQYGTESQCEAALEKSRWGKGFVCPKCGTTRHSTFSRHGQKYWQCTAHKHQSTLRTGTLFQASKLPLRKWYLGMFFISQSKTNISALSLKRMMGVSYPTAWLIKHKLMQAMAEREEGRQLSGRVVADDAYLGGVTSGGKRGRGAKKANLFMAAVEAGLDSSVRYVRFDTLPGLSAENIKCWAKKALQSHTHLVTDGYSSLKITDKVVTHHEAITVSPGKSSDQECFRWVNTVISNLKNSMRGAYHGFKVEKYAQRYLAEAQYRFNRRFQLEELVPRLLYACAHNEPRNLNWIRNAELSC